MAAVLMVCLGNICRSPMAEALFAHKVTERGAVHTVDAAGTAGWHEGKGADPRTIDVLRRHGIARPMRSRKVRDEDFERFDLILAMDGENLADLRARCPAAHQHKLHLALEPTTGGHVPDPYYGGNGGFDHVYGLLDAALDAWLERLA